MLNWQKKKINTLDDISVGNRLTLVRLDLNVPLTNGTVLDDSRLKAVVPTLKYLHEQGGRTVLSSHLGRPKGNDLSLSLKPIAARLSKVSGYPIKHISNTVGEEVDIAKRELQPGNFVLLENTRFETGETKNDAALAEQLADGIDVYINDAFGTLHRAHASTAGVAERVPVCAAGRLVERELAALTPLLGTPARPFTLIMGGAKVSDKIALLRNLLTRIDYLIIGGGMAFTFLKAKGIEIGDSLVDNERLDLVTQLLADAESMGKRLLLPIDFRIEGKGGAALTQDHIEAGQRALDIGPKSAAQFRALLLESATLFWNGPLGVFEQKAFRQGTLTVAKAVAECGGKTIIGGGDTLAAFAQQDLVGRVTHASTGGGATLELLEGKELPGLIALCK